METVFNKWSQREILKKYDDDPHCYAAEIHARYPDIELDRTGGGCSALVKRLANGGWAVLTTDAVAPVAPEDNACLALCVYQYDDEGWGQADWETLVDNGDDGVVTVEEAIQMMAAMPSGAENDSKVYHWFGGEAYAPVTNSWERVKDYWHFSEDSGYDIEDIAAIRRLDVGQSYTSDRGMAGEHVTIVRVK